MIYKTIRTQYSTYIMQYFMFDIYVLYVLYGDICIDVLYLVRHIPYIYIYIVYNICYV